MEPVGQFNALAISRSGMAAERMRMEVIANNLANAQTTRTPDGGPFRRQEVVLTSHVSDADSAKPRLGGVEVAEVVDDPSPAQQVYMPGHPDANADGYVAFPNVRLPMEMVNLMTAMRSYEANLKAALAYKQVNEQALILMRGS